MGPFGIVQPVLAVRRVPVRPGGGEVGRRAAADGVDVEPVDAVRQAGGVDAELTPPAVCHARTVPIGAPSALTSAIGAPPASGQAVVVQAPSAAAAAATINVRMIFSGCVIPDPDPGPALLQEQAGTGSSPV